MFLAFVAGATLACQDPAGAALNPEAGEDGSGIGETSSSVTSTSVTEGGIPTGGGAGTGEGAGTYGTSESPDGSDEDPEAEELKALAHGSDDEADGELKKQEDAYARECARREPPTCQQHQRVGSR